ncbi:MAG TPA: 30S ribosomal protein S8 [Candidatus Omnitrophica bacterium]|nr:30S ribosomal protein S8 [Candidatus Omnitrophota bacterium]
MSVSDPIADLLVSLKNASHAGRLEVVTSISKFKLSILKVLKQEGFIDDYRNTGGKKANIVIRLKFYDREPAIRDVRRISKPGRRVYVEKDEIPTSLGSNRVWIMSTSQGILTGEESSKRGVGGELICYVE